MEKLIKVEWEIRDTRDMLTCYRTGTSTIKANVKNNVEAANIAIDFCTHLPSWELERNNINLQQYRENEKSCRYYYSTKLSKIISIRKAQ